MTAPIVISYELLGRNGRLGNQLWQIASTVGIAARKNKKPRFPRWEYEPFFCCPDKWFQLGRVGKDHLDATKYADSLEPRTRTYLQDLALFENVESEIREAFQPSPDAQAKLNGLAALPNDRETIALHVRRTDVVQKPWANPPCPVEYYRRALVGLPEDALLVIFGDDVPWECKLGKQLGRDHLIVTGEPRIAADWIGPEAYAALPPPTDWIDLFLQQQCTYHVIANSTFSWWAAWLADDKDTRYPAPWFGHVLEEYCDHTLLIPPGWKEIDWR